MSIQGLTTAASLWLVAAVGLAAGGGMYLEAVVATLITLLGLILLRRVEGKQWRQLRRQVTIFLEGGGGGGEAILQHLRDQGASVSDVDYDRNVKANRSRLRLDVGFPEQAALERILASLEGLPSVRRIKVERPG